MSQVDKKPTKLVNIVINGTSKEVEKDELTFEEIVQLAFANPPYGANTQVTIVYTRGVGNKPAGTLVEGQSVKIKDRMEFDVTSTNKS